ncbi:hypothetical protein U1Q18_006796 [Sarracenia purpurea var. burkii]
MQLKNDDDTSNKDKEGFNNPGSLGPSRRRRKSHPRRYSIRRRVATTAGECDIFVRRNHASLLPDRSGFGWETLLYERFDCCQWQDVKFVKARVMWFVVREGVNLSLRHLRSQQHFAIDADQMARVFVFQRSDID